MSHSNDHAHEIRNPGPWKVPGVLTPVFLVMAVIGIVVFAIGVSANPIRAWSAFAVNHFFFLSLGLGGIFFAAVQWLTGAMWSAPVRRLSESFTAYLPIAVLTFIVLLFGLHHLYQWTDLNHVASDPVLQVRAGYFSFKFFTIRNLLGLLVLIFLTWKMVGNSIAQDKDGSYSWTLKNKSLAPGFLILFGVLFTMMSFDQMMSMDTHFFSTMFGVYLFAGLFYATLAMTCLLALHFRGNGQLEGIVNDNHIHDIGKFMFGMTVFWAYIGFSQFMLIWYANLTEETGFFITRMHGSWLYVSAFLAFGKFMLPFFLLLPRDAKRDPKLLSFTALFMLAAHWIDLFWVVQPNFFKEGPVFGLTEIGVTIGFIGLFGFMVTRFLGRFNLVAIGDPRLPEAVFHHHQ
ncbi:MAG: hypothetical protein ACJ763_20495 [Bdellovibrionia bacterium]